MAYADALVREFGPAAVTLWPEDEDGLMDLPTLLGNPKPGQQVYSCGPESLLAAVERITSITWPDGDIHLERFTPRAVETHGPDAPITVECARSGVVCPVTPGRSIAAALEEAGVFVPVSCQEGVCGSCETEVLAGIPDHRDSVLEDWERDRVDTIFVCVSWAKSARLTLDI